MKGRTFTVLMDLRISKPVFLSPPHPGKIPLRDGFGEPDAVDGLVEHIAAAAMRAVWKDKPGAGAAPGSLDSVC